ncbi:MAG: IclR family transcriptional regulator, partial [Desulfomonilaceae bacterium]
MKPTTKATVPALQRGIDVVELLASSERPLSFSEILARLKIPRASLVRILDTLLYRGLIDKMEANGHYRVGIKLLYIGHRLKDKISLRSVAWPLMQWLSEQTGETVELAVLDNGQLLL